MRFLIVLSFYNTLYWRFQYAPLCRVFTNWVTNDINVIWCSLQNSTNCQIKSTTKLITCTGLYSANCLRWKTFPVVELECTSLEIFTVLWLLDVVSHDHKIISLENFNGNQSICKTYITFPLQTVCSIQSKEAI